MSTRIRLTRTGKKHQPTYRVVVIDSRSPRDGRAKEVLGFYNPHLRENSLQISKDRYEYWVKSGAQPSEAVTSLVAGTYKYVPYEPNKKVDNISPTETVEVTPAAEETESPETEPEA